MLRRTWSRAFLSDPVTCIFFLSEDVFIAFYDIFAAVIYFTLLLLWQSFLLDSNLAPNVFTTDS